MEEESKGRTNNKYITTEGLANIDSPFNKQIEEIREAAIRAGEKLIEAFKPVIETVAKVAVNIRDEIIKIYKADPEIKKCYGIYKRTRKRKDKKKANDQDK